MSEKMMGGSNRLVTFLSAFAAGYFVFGTNNKLNMQVSIYYVNYCTMEIMLVWGCIKKLHTIVRENFTLNNYVKIVYGKNFFVCLGSQWNFLPTTYGNKLFGGQNY